MEDQFVVDLVWEQISSVHDSRRGPVSALSEAAELVVQAIIILLLLLLLIIIIMMMMIIVVILLIICTTTNSNGVNDTSSYNRYY